MLRRWESDALQVVQMVSMLKRFVVAAAPLGLWRPPSDQIHL